MVLHLVERIEEAHCVCKRNDKGVNILLRVIKVEAGSRTCIYSEIPMEWLCAVMS